MPGELDLAVRGPKAYAVARAAIEMMEEAQVWPTALNFELWLHVLANPNSALAREIQRLPFRRDATTDGMTNHANRKSFDEELERACAEADAQGGLVQLAVLDIDHFKHFNDTWGHQTGDQVIRYVASVIGRVGAPPRFAARYGGEEFAIIFAQESARQVERTLADILEEVASRMLKRRSAHEDLRAITISTR